MKNKPLQPTFIPLVLRFSVVFLVVVMVIELLFTYFKNGNLNAVNESFTDYSWVNYLLIKTGIALFYGVLMAFLTIRKFKKSK